MEILAALVHAPKQPFAVEPVELDDPQPDEVLVRIVATGLCHTDLGIRDGDIVPMRNPLVLGHEGAGVVIAVGANVTRLAVGDHVALTFASCGHCPQCNAGVPAHCDEFFPLNFAGRRPDGSCTHHQHGKELTSSFFGQSSFGTYALVNQRNAVKVPKEVPLELLGPLGCAVQTGAGTVLNFLKPKPNSSIAVFGAGAVGLSAVMAAVVAGCKTIVAIDIHHARLALARELGATHTINARDVKPADTLKELIAGGPDHVIEASGLPHVMATAIESGRRFGTVTLLGAWQLGVKVTVDMLALVSGATICAVTEGHSDPQVFIPRLIELYRAGKFPFDKMLKFYELNEINQAAQDSENGLAIKPVIRMPRNA